MIAGAKSSARRARLLLWLYVSAIFVWMFDFKSSEAGAGLAVQSIFIVAYAAFIAGFFLHDRGWRSRVRGFGPFAIAALLFVAVGSVSGLINGQEPYAIFRNGFTVVLYLSVSYATARTVLCCSLESLRRVLGWLCLGFAVSTFLIMLLFQGGVDLQTIRYQIQGSSSIAALGLVSLAFVFPLRPIEFVTILVSGLVTFLTVTRTYLVIFAGQLLALCSFGKRFFRKRSALVFVSAGVVSALVLFAFPEVSERWVYRLFIRERFGGIDPTLLTRQVEWDYMLGSFLSSPYNFLMGSGMAAETSYYLARNLGGGSGVSSSVGFGHNNHISLLFIGGLLGGAPLLLVQLSQVVTAIRFNMQRFRGAHAEGDAAFLGAWGGMIVIGTFVVGFLSPLFSDRGFSIWYGIGTGLLLGARALLRIDGRARPA